MSNLVIPACFKQNFKKKMNFLSIVNIDFLPNNNNNNCVDFETQIYLQTRILNVNENIKFWNFHYFFLWMIESSM